LTFALWRSYIVHKINSINPMREIRSDYVPKKELVKEIQRNKVSSVRPSVIKASTHSNQLALRYIYNSDIAI
jgi:hypothetical protein